MGDTYNVRLEPVGVEFSVEEDETVLDAAFRQGIALPHGCKEGQCSACKCVLTDGEVDLLKYSTFALSEMERDTDHILLCRAVCLDDIEVELLNYDEEALSKSIAVQEYEGEIVTFDKLTHDIRSVQIKLNENIKFWAGQYVDIIVETPEGDTIKRSFSMANVPTKADELSFIIKKYPEGRFSGLLDSGGIKIGQKVKIVGPYGDCFRREDREGAVVLVGAGSGMSPIWSILHDHIASDEERPVYFFYGARTQEDLFYLDQISDLTNSNKNINFIPVLSDADDDNDWKGERGFVHEVVGSKLRELGIDGEGDVYACGPPPMIDALSPFLFMNGFEPERIFYDAFTPSTPIE